MARKYACHIGRFPALRLQDLPVLAFNAANVSVA
jgi:hypothetical protein